MKAAANRLIPVLLTFFFAGYCFCQSPTAEVTGRISDSSGAVIPGAEIQLTNAGNGGRWQTTTNDSGNYSVSLLPPGTYRLTASRQGFKTLTRDNFDLVVSQIARLDLTMELGAVSENVEVTAQASLLDSASASLGQVVGTKTVNDLPLNGRNYLQLVRLSAGVVEPRPGDVGTAGQSFSANGVRSELNNFIMDGADNNSRIVNIQNRSYQVIQPSVDAIQEFKLETNTYSAEYGYSAGAVVNVVLKSGTNQVHGSAFEFIRNSVLDARDFFAPRTQAAPILQRNQYGVAAGAPIVKNRLFLFGSWEGTAQNVGTTLITTLPGDALRAGNFAGKLLIFDPATTQANPSGAGFVRTPFPNNSIPADRISPAAAKLVSLLPQANLPGTANNYVNNPKATQRINRVDSRGDLNISDRDKLFEHYDYATSNILAPGVFDPPLVGGTSNSVNDSLDNAIAAAVGETHILSPAAVNEFRASYTRIYDSSNSLASGPFQGLGIPGVPGGTGLSGLPSFGISGYTTLGEASGVPSVKLTEVLQFLDNVSVIRGNHTLKFGASFEWVRNWYSTNNNVRGAFSFSPVFTQNPQQRAGTGDGFGDFLLGLPASATIGTPQNGDVRQDYLAGFAEDDWKVTPKLTLDIGLRYDYWIPRIERNNLQANFLPGLNKLIYPENKTPSSVPASFVAPIPDGLGSRSLVKPDARDFGPRIGLAYQLTPKTVLRAGYGIFYAAPQYPGVGATIAGNPPFSGSQTFSTDQNFPNITLATGFPPNAGRITSVNPAALTLYSSEPNQRVAYVQKWSLGVQQAIGENYKVEANYVGTQGTHLMMFYNINQDYAGGGSVASRRPIQGYSDISVTTPMSNASDNAIQATVERRQKDGLTLLAAYTYGKTIDEGGEQLGAGDLFLRDVLNVKDERGLAAFDRLQRLVLNALYELPIGKGRAFSPSNRIVEGLAGGWHFNGIFTALTGQPVTPELGFSAANTGDPRPNRVGSGNLPSDRRSIANWFDKTAFVAPVAYNYGNAGRNILTGPGAVNLDFSTFKSFPFSVRTETGQIQIRAEFFNVLNHPQFANPNSRVDIPQGGTITALAVPMRQIQFGAKIIF